jgi:hypothetical protein
MDTAHIWKRIGEGEKTSPREAWTLLRAMLEAARRRHAGPETAIEEAGIIVASALDRMSALTRTGSEQPTTFGSGPARWSPRRARGSR